MAGIWGHFVSIFQKNSSSDVQEESTLPEGFPVPQNLVAQEMPQQTEGNNDALQDPEAPHWLLDEEALRDEGVLFGLAGSDPAVKTDIIQKFYARLMAPFDREIEEVNERIQELNLFIEQRQTRIKDLKYRLLQLETSPVKMRPHQVLRTGAGLLLSLLMCVGNYSLIDQSLQNNFSQSNWVALGVFMAGMFNLFGSVSVFHDDQRERPGFWRLLEETGMPVAASLFVFANVWGSIPWWQSVALFIFVLFLFLFSGKLFLGLITVFREDLYKWMYNRKDARKEALDKVIFEEEIVKLNEEIDAIRTQKWQRIREQGTAEEQKAGLMSKRDMLIRVFESEFDLARQLKSTGRIKGISEL